MIILKENFKWHLEAFASELFVYIHYIDIYILAQLNPFRHVLAWLRLMVVVAKPLIYSHNCPFNVPKNRKYPVSGSSVGENDLLLPEFRGKSEKIIVGDCPSECRFFNILTVKG